jgi:hypothetical protein
MIEPIWLTWPTAPFPWLGNAGSRGPAGIWDAGLAAARPFPDHLDRHVKDIFRLPGTAPEKTPWTASAS